MDKVSPMARRLSVRMQGHRRLQLLHMDQVSFMPVEEPGDCQAKCSAIGDCIYFAWIRLVFCHRNS
jgi:hypothetical protein